MNSNNKNIIKSLGGGGVFYKQFKKVVNPNNTINCKNQNFIKFKINNILAFSLIELSSIVLIIIGLLVAGIAGSASLIESAKIQATINELRSYKQAVYTFKSIKNRLPGDFVDSGFTGYLSGQTYSNSSFGEPYVTSNKDYGLPDSYSGPFVDLYLNKVIDFEPKKTTPSVLQLSNTNGGTPHTKSFPNYVYYYENIE